MPRPIAVQKAGTVAKRSGNERAPRERRMESRAQRVALVVVEITEASAVAKLSGIGNESAGNDTGAFDHLIRVSQKHVEAIFEARRANRRFPAMNAGALDGERKKNVGASERVVIEEIQGVRLEIGEVQTPAAYRNREAEFALFVRLSMQREKARTGRVQQRAGDRGERRSLKEAAIRRAKNPIEFWKAKGGAEARIGFVFDDSAGEMRVAEAAVEREPFGQTKLVFGERAEERAMRPTHLRRR